MSVTSWVDRVFFTQATVADVVDVAPRFRIMTLEGPELAKTTANPGDKIQVRARGLSLRTYTPVGWDRAKGRAKVVAFVHGEGPGALWTQALRAGDTCAFFGPRSSIALAKAKGPVILFGDETSIGVAASLHALRGKDAHLVLEADSRDAVAPVLDALALSHATVCARTGDHLRDAAERIAAVKDASIILTGCAASIVTVRQHLRTLGAPATFKAKTYWAEGRTGID